MGSIDKTKMKLFGAFFLASANAEGRGACMAQVRETIAANPIINGEWNCERTGKDAVNCSVKCNSGSIHGWKKQPFIKGKDCDSEHGQFKTNVEGEGLECDDEPELKCGAKSTELLETLTIDGGYWRCKGKPGAKYRYINMSDCRSDDPEISYEGFNGEPLACKRSGDWCDEKAASYDIVNGSMVPSAGRYKKKYTVTCADGRRVAEYACTGSSYYGFPHFKTMSYGPPSGSLDTDTVCATNCSPSELDEMHPLGAGQWNCELNRRKTSFDCRAKCDHGPKRLGFSMECGRFGWRKIERNPEDASTCDAAEE